MLHSFPITNTKLSLFSVAHVPTFQVHMMATSVQLITDCLKLSRLRGGIQWHFVPCSWTYYKHMHLAYGVPERLGYFIINLFIIISVYFQQCVHMLLFVLRDNLQTTLFSCIHVGCTRLTCSVHISGKAHNLVTQTHFCTFHSNLVIPAMEVH